MKKRRIVFGILSLVWCLVIFIYSAMGDADSEARSYFVGKLLYRTFNPEFETLDTITQSELVMGIDHYVRKGAHMTEFAILATLMFLAVLPPVRKMKHRDIPMNALLAFVMAVFYATTDEFHQLFVPGRAGMIRDVCIDSAGMIIGLLLCMLGTAFKIKKVNKE